MVETYLQNRHHIKKFAAAMEDKMDLAADKGRGGWSDKSLCSQDDLSRMLREHVEKGDPIDVANFCMMLHQRGELISPDANPRPKGPFSEVQWRTMLLMDALEEEDLSKEAREAYLALYKATTAAIAAPSPDANPHMTGDGEAAFIECLSAGEPFVFDPATNFLHADDGTVEGGIRYLPDVSRLGSGMMQIKELIFELEGIHERFGNTCVYIREGGMSWGAVALNRRDADAKAASRATAAEDGR